MEKYHITASVVWLYLICFSEENIWRDLETKPAPKKCKNTISVQCLPVRDCLSNVLSSKDVGLHAGCKLSMPSAIILLLHMPSSQSSRSYFFVFCVQLFSPRRLLACQATRQAKVHEDSAVHQCSDGGTFWIPTSHLACSLSQKLKLLCRLAI